jgi:hypothetical protein
MLSNVLSGMGMIDHTPSQPADFARAMIGAIRAIAGRSKRSRAAPRYCTVIVPVMPGCIVHA